MPKGIPKNGINKGWFKKGFNPWIKGKHHSKKTKEKMRLAKLGKKNEETNNWKGDKVGYRSLHYWIRNNLGKPDICKFCGKEKTTPKSIHWANKGHKYKRNLNDWISLCVKCHKKYDRKTVEIHY